MDNIMALDNKASTNRICENSVYSLYQGDSDTTGGILKYLLS